MLYKPSADVTVVLVSLVPMLTAVIVTPGSTAPLLSFAVPVRLALAACPNAVPGTRATMEMTKQASRRIQPPHEAEKRRFSTEPAFQVKKALDAFVATMMLLTRQTCRRGSRSEDSRRAHRGLLLCGRRGPYRIRRKRRPPLRFWKDSGASHAAR